MTDAKEFFLRSSDLNESDAVFARLLDELREIGSHWKDELSVISFISHLERDYGSELAQRVAESSELRSITSELLTV